MEWKYRGWSDSLRPRGSGASPERDRSCQRDMDHVQQLRFKRRTLAGRGLRHGSGLATGGRQCWRDAEYQCKASIGQLSELRFHLRLSVFPQRQLEFLINGESQGVAASDMPSSVFAVVDIYGKCVQVSLVQPSEKPSNLSESSKIRNSC
jgi:Neuralized